MQRVAKVENLTKAFALARSLSPTQRVMVEQFLDGPRVSTESLIIDGRCHTPGLSDRNSEYPESHAPFFVETGGDSPSRLPPDIQAKIKDVVARAASALGVTHGTVKSDIVVHNGEPHVIGLAAHLSGGFFCTREIPLSTGVDFIGCAIRLALGESVSAEELEPRGSRAVVQRYAFPNPGRVVAIDGAEQAKNIPGIADVVVTIRSGEVIPSSAEERPSAAMVLATGESRETALAAANDAIACLKIRTA